jgi:cyclic dehypoxanthinyl futalosine synthase
MNAPELSHKDRRYNRQQALELLTDLPMGELMNLAHRERMQRFADPTVTFVVDTNPNTTNVCVTGCAFCAFYRKATDTDAYLLSPAELAAKVEAAAAQGQAGARSRFGPGKADHGHGPDARPLRGRPHARPADGPRRC